MNTKLKVAGSTLNGSQNRPGNGLSGALEFFIKGAKTGDRGRISCVDARGDQARGTSVGRWRRRIKDTQRQFPLIDTTIQFSNVHTGEVGILASEAEVMFSVPLVLTPQDPTDCGVAGGCVKDEVRVRRAGQRQVEVERVGDGRGGSMGMAGLICLMGLPEGNFHAKGLDRAGISAKKRGSLEGTAP